MTTIVNFCCRSGGSNLNAGTLTGDATEPGTSASFTYASGDWVQSTRVFTVASGDPASDGVAVGDYCSVYSDGSSTTGYVAQVTARDATTITLSSSVLMGTAPTDGTGNRTLKVGGAWLGPNGSDIFPFNTVNRTLASSASIVRVNMKNDATYSISATLGVTNGNVLYQGYTTSYGDLGKATIDGGGTAMHVITNNSSHYNSFADLIVVNSAGSGEHAGIYWDKITAVLRCVAHGMRGSGLYGEGFGIVVECEAYDCGASNQPYWGGFTGGNAAITWVRCYSHDNTQVGFWFGSSSMRMINCIAADNSGNGVYTEQANSVITGCDFYNNGNNGVALAANAQAYIENSNFIANGGYGVSGPTTTSPLPLFFANCGIGAGTAANTSGGIQDLRGSIIQIGTVTYPSNETPWNDPANGDFTITLDEAKGAGRGAFTQTDSGLSAPNTVGYPDIGAAQHEESAGGGGGGLKLAGNGGLAG